MANGRHIAEHDRRPEYHRFAEEHEQRTRVLKDGDFAHCEITVHEDRRDERRDKKGRHRAKPARVGRPRQLRMLTEHRYHVEGARCCHLHCQHRERAGAVRHESLVRVAQRHGGEHPHRDHCAHVRHSDKTRVHRFRLTGTLSLTTFIVALRTHYTIDVIVALLLCCCCCDRTRPCRRHMRRTVTDACVCMACGGVQPGSAPAACFFWYR